MRARQTPPQRAIPEVKAAQYIDLMQTALSRWVSWAQAQIRPTWTNWSAPSCCQVCLQWQTQIICTNCINRWRSTAPRCPRCAIELKKHLDFCQSCDDLSPEFDRAVVALDYASPWSTLISRLKFQDDCALARPLSQLLLAQIRQRPHQVDLIVPVPLSRTRLRERGYNQSWLLAQQLGKQLGIPAHHDLLRRIRDTERLMSLDAQARQQQIQGAFDVPDTGLSTMLGRHVALVDDVLTTGATLNEAARCLLDAGAASVSAWAVARTPAPSHP
jgi:ComF family protein